MSDINTILAGTPAVQSNFLPEEAKRRLIAAQLLQKQAADTSAPIYSTGAGMAKLGAGLLGGLMEGYTDSQVADRNKVSGLDIARYIGMQQGAPVAAPAAAAAPMGALPSMPAAGVVPNDGNAAPGTVGMNQRLADLSYDFIDDNPGTSLSSGMRSTADQARLYADRGNNPNPVAVPGTSKHERGMAVDIGGMTPDQRAMLPSFGLAQPVRNDPPHVELAITDPSQQPYQVAGPTVAAPGAGSVQPSPQALAAALQPGAAVAPPGPDRMALAAKILSDPYTPPWAREYIAKQMQPDNQLMQMPDGTVVSIDKRTNKAATVYQGAVKPIEVNGRLVNPQTGQLVADFSNPQTATVGDTLVNVKTGQPIFKGEKPAIEYMKDDNGRIIGFDKTKLGPGQDVTPAGTGTQANPYAPPGKQPNNEQSNNANYANRMVESHSVISGLESQAADPAQRALSAIPGVGNYAVSSDTQKVNQAKRDFMTAVLRRESGASISSGEFATADKQYFPQPGDSAEVMAQKRINRETTIKGVMAGAGQNYKPPAGFKPGETQAVPKQEPQAIGDGATATNPQTGERMIRQNGKWVPLA